MWIEQCARDEFVVMDEALSEVAVFETLLDALSEYPGAGLEVWDESLMDDQEERRIEARLAGFTQ